MPDEHTALNIATLLPSKMSASNVKHVAEDAAINIKAAAEGAASTIKDVAEDTTKSVNKAASEASKSIMDWICPPGIDWGLVVFGAFTTGVIILAVYEIRNKRKKVMMTKKSLRKSQLKPSQSFLNLPDLDLGLHLLILDPNLLDLGLTIIK